MIGMISRGLSIIHNLSQKRLVRILLFAALFFIVIAILLSVLYQNREMLLTYPWEINLWALGATFITYSLGVGLIISGWFRLIRSLIPKGSYYQHFRIYVLTNLAKRIPGPLIHIAGRLVMYQSVGIEAKFVTVGSGIEAVLLLLSAILSYLLAMGFSHKNQYFEWWLITSVALGLILIHPKSITFLLSKLKKQSNVQALSYTNSLTWLVFYIAGWILGGMTVFWLINVLTPLPATHLPDVVAAWTLAGTMSSLIFFSPSGLGVQEITLAVMLSQLIPAPVAVIIAVLLRVMLMSYQMIWAGLVLFVDLKQPAHQRFSFLLRKDY